MVDVVFSCTPWVPLFAFVTFCGKNWQITSMMRSNRIFRCLGVEPCSHHLEATLCIVWPHILHWQWGRQVGQLPQLGVVVADAGCAGSYCACKSTSLTTFFRVNVP